MKEEGFSAKYWSDNYNDPNSMDGIGNAKDHVRYLKALLTLDNVKINSIIDFGFGKSVLLKEMIRDLIPIRQLALNHLNIFLSKYNLNLFLKIINKSK
ncbi:MAG: hypothetical protein HOJ35_07895 [Bdellovibrionales bacterium]|nr:hypothetical protein [Bdellovibrionales bacterium]